MQLKTAKRCKTLEIDIDHIFTFFYIVGEAATARNTEKLFCWCLCFGGTLVGALGVLESSWKLRTALIVVLIGYQFNLLQGYCAFQVVQSVPLWSLSEG